MPYSDIRTNFERIKQTQNSSQGSVDVINNVRDKGELLVGDGTKQSYLDPTTGSDNDVLIFDSAESVGIKWGLPNHLTPSGVTAGSHTLSNITVDEQGLVLSLSTGTVDINDVTPTTTKGDLLVEDGTPELVRLPVGSDNELLTVDTAEATSMKWGSLDINDYTPTSAIGDLIVDDGANAPSGSLISLSVGADGTFLVADSGEPAGLKYGVIEDIIPFTVKGDLLIHNNFGSVVVLPNSNNDNDLFTVDNTVTSVLTAWKQLDINTLTPNTTTGDLLVHDNNGNIVRLPIGNHGDVLTVDTTVTPIAMAWKPPPSTPASDQYTMLHQGRFTQVNNYSAGGPWYLSDDNYDFSDPWSTSIGNAFKFILPFEVKGVKLQFAASSITGDGDLTIEMRSNTGVLLPGSSTAYGMVNGSTVRDGQVTYTLTTPIAANTPFTITVAVSAFATFNGRTMAFAIHE